MTAIQDKLKELADKFKKPAGLNQQRIENMKKVVEAAKQAAKEVKTGKA